MESAFLLTTVKCVVKAKGRAGPSLDLGQMDEVMSSGLFQPIFSSDIYAFPLMTLNTPLHYLSIAMFLIFNFFFYFLLSVCHTCCCVSWYCFGQVSHIAAAMGLSSMRLAAVSVPRAGRAVTAPTPPAPATAAAMGAVTAGSVSVMSLTLVRTAATSSVLRTAAAMGSVTQPKGSASATRSSSERTAVRNDVPKTAVAMGSVTQESATATTASLALTVPRVRHACELFLPYFFQSEFPSQPPINIWLIL